nr:MATE family efflux transporter [uncultured Agathobacter sp.]
MKTREFDKIFYKKLWMLMFPIMLQNLMLALVAVADAFMLGGLDQNYMSAVSLATQIQFIQNMFLSASTAGLAILGAQYWGKRDIKTLDDIFSMAIRICGIVSVLFFVACAFFPKYLMLIFTNEPVLIDYGVSYLRIAAFSYLLTGFSQCYIVMMKISEHAGSAAAVSSITVVLNILLNAIFIYGAFGIRSMNVRGAALATLIARIVELLLAVIFSYRQGFIRLKVHELFVRNKQLSKDFMKCSGPILGASLVWGIGFTSYSSFMGHLGTDAAAANSVAAVVRDIICCLSAGISSAAGIMVGNELGAGNLKRGKTYGIRLLKLSVVCGVIMTILMAVSAPVILYFVKLTPQAGVYLKQMFVVLALYMIGRSMNEVIINGIFGSGGDTMFDMYSLAVTMWGIAIPLAVAGTYFLNWPVVVVYACTCVDEIGKIPWTLIHFKKYKWVKDLTR